MKITITEAHRILSNGLINAPSEHEWCTAFKMAINTMRKYQKIEQIIDDWKSDGGAFEMSESYWLKQIREVIKDGKID